VRPRSENVERQLQELAALGYTPYSEKRVILRVEIRVAKAVPICLGEARDLTVEKAHKKSCGIHKGNDVNLE
jgi:hypothetical protein